MTFESLTVKGLALPLPPKRPIWIHISMKRNRLHKIVKILFLFFTYFSTYCPIQLPVFCEIAFGWCSGIYYEDLMSTMQAFHNVLMIKKLELRHNPGHIWMIGADMCGLFIFNVIYSSAQNQKCSIGIFKKKSRKKFQNVWFIVDF